MRRGAHISESCCHILAPGLLGPVGLPTETMRALDRELPALCELLRRGRRDTTEIASVEERACDLFGLSRAPDGDWPMGALRYLGDGGAPERDVWYCADPVHLRADRDRVVLIAGPGLGLEATDSDALIAAFNALYGSEGLELVATTPDRWYLRTSALYRVSTHPLSSVAGGSLERFLPSGPDERAVRALLNEVQMLFHGQETNDRRSERGVAAVNGLWLWGGGRLPEALRSQWAVVATDEPLLRGLARLSGATIRDIAEAGMGPAREGDTLWVSTRARLALEEGEPARWLSAVRAFESECAAPALRALDRGELREVVLEDALGRRWTAARRRFPRLWGRGRFADFMATGPVS